jgi:hypothetical protein
MRKIWGGVGICVSGSNFRCVESQRDKGANRQSGVIETHVGRNDTTRRQCSKLITYPRMAHHDLNRSQLGTQQQNTKPSHPTTEAPRRNTCRCARVSSAYLPNSLENTIQHLNGTHERTSRNQNTKIYTCHHHMNSKKASKFLQKRSWFPYNIVLILPPRACVKCS